MEFGENSIYIVDKDYKIVYYNKHLEGAIPGMKCGDICYRVMNKSEEPCERCPLSGYGNGGNIVLNRRTHKWLDIKTSEINWPGVGACNLVMTSVVDDPAQSLMLNLPGDYNYEALLELNLTKNSFKKLYHRSGKLQLPDSESSLGKLRKMVEYSRENLIHPDDRAKHRAFWDIDTMVDRMNNSDTKGVIKGVFREKNPEGEWNYIQQVLISVRLDGTNDQYVLCFLYDIHKMMEQENMIDDHTRHMTRVHDPITGLYREHSFYDRMGKLLKESGDKRMCIIAIDIEYFRLFNKWYGRAAGDELLITIGTYLKSLKTEYGFVSGYFGGDDFVIVMDDDETYIGALINEITKAVSQYGTKTEFHPVFGAYRISNKSDSLENMYECAKTALKHALGHYKTTFCWYDKNLGDTDEEELILVTKVQKALEEEEFVFYSQPKCNLKDGRIVGAEALVRWNSKTEGLISPGKFIPTLERNGFITNLDRYLWEKVCMQLRKWLDEGIRPVPISVNVSRMDIYSMDVPTFFRNLTHKYNLDKSLIELEITETAYVEEFAIVKDAIKELRDLGFKVLIDDFGSGYSSLNMLKDINVDLLKLDMKFLDIGENNRVKGVGILESVVDMAHAMRLPVIAEGVETENQADALRNIGCTYAQGYFFYKPLPVEEFEKLLTKEEEMDYDGIVVNY